MILRMLCRMWTAVSDALAYAGHRMTRKKGSGFCLGQSPAVRSDRERELNPRLLGYPPNHNCRLQNGRLRPSFKLYQRALAVTALYPQPLTSFLDIGSCRGYYVLDAAGQPGCQRAVGIDLEKDFISVANDLRDYMGVANASFRLASLDDLTDDLSAVGGLFQTVLLIGTYHYLFWGSRRSSVSYHSHEGIFDRLAGLCTDRLIVSARLEVARLPDYIRQETVGAAERDVYTTERFLEAARRHFEVRTAGSLGRHTLYVMQH
ncbi:MAG: hypothetical protein HQ546_07420 [Planctomycetes bacterium]|nr:hypothetical protein [Planctomycetota bacterium]